MLYNRHVNKCNAHTVLSVCMMCSFTRRWLLSMEPETMIAHHTDVQTTRAARGPSVLDFAPFFEAQGITNVHS